MPKSTCNRCNRNILLVRVGGDLVATDPELMSVIPATDRQPSPRSEQSRIEMAHRQTFARRLHAERCDSYQEQDRRDRILAEQREYNRKNGRSPRRNQGL